MNKTQALITARTRLALAAGLVLALSAGQAAAQASPAASARQAELSRVGALLPLAQFGTADNTPLAVAARAGTLASLLAGSPVPAAAPDVAARVLALSPERAEFAVRNAGGARFLVDAPAEPARGPQAAAGASDEEIAAHAQAAARAYARDPAESIRVLLDARGHEALALHGAVAGDYLSQADVGATQARATFDNVLQALQASGTSGLGALGVDAVSTARLMQAERAADGPVTTRVKAYLFDVPVVVGAIPVFGAEASVAVHRSGQVASIRLTGPTAQPAQRGAALVRTVSPDVLERRARAEHPGAKIVPLGVQYPWLATQDTALAARPRQVFQVQPRGMADDGQATGGRPHYVFYSVEDMRAAPLVWPQPQPQARGDKR